MFNVCYYEEEEEASIRQCSICYATTTSQWRFGKRPAVSIPKRYGSRSHLFRMCNACGIRHQRKVRISRAMFKREKLLRNKRSSLDHFRPLKMQIQFLLNNASIST